MIRYLRCTTLAVFALWLWLGPAAAADNIVALLTDFGFIGTWAQTCGVPAAPGNINRIVTVSPTGVVSWELTAGPKNGSNHYVVLGARLSAPNTVILKIEFNGSETDELTIVKEGNRTRTMENHKIDGEVFVKNGVGVESGTPTPWMTKCN